MRPTLTIQPVGDLSERHISDAVSRKPRGKDKTVSAQTYVFSSGHHGVTTACQPSIAWVLHPQTQSAGEKKFSGRGRLGRRLRDTELA